MKRILVTGANRGLGLEFVRQYLETGERVFACCRDPDAADALQRLVAEHSARASVHALDVTRGEQLLPLIQELSLRESALDVLINNAGVMPTGERFGHLDPQVMLDTYQVNAVAPLMLTQALLPLLREGQRPRVIHISSALGSIARCDAPRSFSYNASKTALNMLMKLSSIELWEQGVLSLAVSPGWVSTDMGGPNAELTPAQSVGSLLQLIEGLRAADNARFVDRHGKDIPW